MFEFLANPVNVLVILGVGALFVGVVGGNIEGRGVRIPPLTGPQRVGAVATGVLLLGTGVGVHVRMAPQAADAAIDDTKSSLQQHQAAEEALRGRIAQLEAERERAQQAAAQQAGREQIARLEALERELADKRKEEVQASERVANAQSKLNQKESALLAAESVVREYYAALNRLDFDAAKARYRNPGPKLDQALGWIKEPGVFNVNKIESESIGPDASYVDVRTDVGARNGKERWQGTVRVSNEAGSWKIASMNLAKAPLNLARVN